MHCVRALHVQHEREAVRLWVRERVPPGHRAEAGDVLRVAAVRGARAVPGAQVRRARGGRLVARRHPLHARLRQPAIRRRQPPRTLLSPCAFYESSTQVLYACILYAPYALCSL